jgi:glyoxylase-like metal-dependent hydrolase (beta-lactamase superfamily II)
MFSHAHFDHYDGIYVLPHRDKLSVWALDIVARPLADPQRWRAPFLDIRPVKFDKTPKDGESLAWREYKFRFHHLPGQSGFTMGVETTIDGKTCFFTADNFFHQDMFSGSGGWMGLNRSSPLLYAASAQKVLDARPEWVLAEHGGPFEFSAEDFRRRVQWGMEAAKAADALCVSGNHLADWNPHRIHVEPLIQKVKAGEIVMRTLVVSNPMKKLAKQSIALNGRGLIDNRTWNLEFPAGATVERNFTVEIKADTPTGRHVFTLRSDGDASDAFFVLDVEK